jgi:hypothetical protein
MQNIQEQQLEVCESHVLKSPFKVYLAVAYLKTELGNIFNEEVTGLRLQKMNQIKKH